GLVSDGPIGDIQSRHEPKVAQVARQKLDAIGLGDGGNAQIIGADADSLLLQVQELRHCCLIKRQYFVGRVVLEHVLQVGKSLQELRGLRARRMKASHPCTCSWNEMMQTLTSFPGNCS